MEATVKTIGLVNGNSVDVYLLESGEFVYSQRSVAKAIGKDNTLAMRFFDSNSFKALRGEGYRLCTINVERKGRGGANSLTAVTSADAVIFWANYGALELVAAYAGAALDKLAAKAFGMRLDVEQTAQDIYDQLRDEHRKWHNAFQSHCEARHWQPWVASKLIVEAVTKREYSDVMQGVEYRSAWSPDQVSLDDLKRINRAKQEFVNSRQKTVRANVTVALEKAGIK